jgi:hypothetical protein
MRPIPQGSTVLNYLVRSKKSRWDVHIDQTQTDLCDPMVCPQVYKENGFGKSLALLWVDVIKSHSILSGSNHTAGCAKHPCCYWSARGPGIHIAATIARLLVREVRKWWVPNISQLTSSVRLKWNLFLKFCIVRGPPLKHGKPESW